MGIFERSNDEALLLTQGAVGMGTGITMMVNPDKAQKILFKKSSSDTMTRVAGSAITIASSYSFHAGYKGSLAQQRMACRCVAAHSALGAAIGITELSSKGGAASKEKLKWVTVMLALNSVLMGWRSTKRGSLL